MVTNFSLAMLEKAEVKLYLAVLSLGSTSEIDFHFIWKSPTSEWLLTLCQWITRFKTLQSSIFLNGIVAHPGYQQQSQIFKDH